MVDNQGDDELKTHIEAMIQGAKEDPLSQTCCIYKVPRSTREKNENMYTPTTISIGPFHYGDPRLRDMERYKVIMLKRFMTSSNSNLDNLISFVRSLEPKVRASYSEVTLAEEVFQRLMLLDGAFIIELFRSFRSCSSSDDNTQNMNAIRSCRSSSDDTQNMNAILRQPRLLSDVTTDLLLLENQLPFFFLDGLYQQAFPDDSFAELSCKFFGSFNSRKLIPKSDDFRHFTDLLRLFHLPKELPERIRLDSSSPKSDDSWINHFTDLLSLFHLPKELPERVRLASSGNNVLRYSAKQLADIDIKFKAASMPCGPLDLKFSNEVLEVPRIWVDDNTAILFRNIITFEQCHGDKHYISDYALLLHCLVNSQEDVNVLIRNGIICNSLDDPSEVVRIFDGHYTDLTLWKFNSNYLTICQALNHTGRDRGRLIRSTLKRQFLRSITGFLLNNILTLIQTIIAIWQATLDNLISFVRSSLPKVRASYSEDTLDEEVFQRLMLLDGAFIIELFRSFSSCRLSDDYTQNMDAILRQPKLLRDVTKDLLLLENQLPFFFLEGLCQKAFPADDVGNPSFAELSCEFFGSFNSQKLSPKSDDFRINHFTDLLRLFHIPKELPERVPLPWSGNDVLLYSAKQLAEIDIKFKVASMRSSGPLDLKFSNEVLEVPRIWVDDNTAILFHNMITFEQCHYLGDKHYISDYAQLLHCLVNSQEDVNVLVRNGIIRNSLGDPSEVVRIFDGHYTDLILWKFNSNYLSICQALNHMGSDRWRQIRPTLKRQFLRFITGLQLNNILTLIQTIIAIWQAT